MNYCIRFSEELEKATNDHVRLAKQIWKAANCSQAVPLRVAAGNYAGYGKYVARCHSTGVIEFPVGNKFSVLRLEGNSITFKGPQQKFLGTLLHEIGHHIVNTATSKPWQGMRDGGSSTHLRKEWIWICHTGWSHFHDDVPAMLTIANALRSFEGRQRKKIVNALTGFSPFKAPPSIEVVERTCDHCNGSMLGKRRRSRFCSDSCRVMASRLRKKAK